MKKLTTILLLLSMCLCICACQGESVSDDSDDSAEETTSVAGAYRDTMSASEIENAVTKAAVEEVLGRLNGQNYNLDATKYKIGSITLLDNAYEYEVSGTLYLYDKYGSVADIATFTCSCVWINENGRATSVGSVTINK